MINVSPGEPIATEGCPNRKLATALVIPVLLFKTVETCCVGDRCPAYAAITINFVSLLKNERL
ncbi:MAG: hypothetical protein Q8R66_09930 [Methanobacteriaceae archaeon]|nr:hypothetical protein [Methanobacteriaceae archaeon]